MSAYCSTSDIQAEIKKLPLDATTPVTTDQVTEFIDQESARINSYITARYTLPISGTESLLFLKRICIALVTWRVSDILSTRKTQMLPNGMISQDLSGATAYKQAVKDLKALAKGDIKLPDESVSNSTPGKAFFSSNNLDTSFESAFDVSEDQW